MSEVKKIRLINRDIKTANDFDLLIADMIELLHRTVEAKKGLIEGKMEWLNTSKELDILEFQIPFLT